MKQFLRFHMESSACITMVIPGAHVPSWFNSRSDGRFIGADVFPNVQDNNWIGFAFCAAFVAQYESSSSIGGRPMVSCLFYSQKRCRLLDVVEIIEPDEITAELTYLCLVLLTRQQVIDYIQSDNIDGFLFTLVGVDRPGLIVKDCASRVVSKQDLEE